MNALPPGPSNLTLASSQLRRTAKAACLPLPPRGDAEAAEAWFWRVFPVVRRRCEAIAPYPWATGVAAELVELDRRLAELRGEPVETLPGAPS